DQNPNTYLEGQAVFGFDLQSEVGNPNVGNEEAETWTFGVVWSWENVTAAIDWYDVDVKDAIVSPDAETIYEQCFNADGVSNPGYSAANQFCQAILRDETTGGRLAVNTMPVNVGGIRTAGVDVQVNWNRDLGPGSLLTNVVLNYLNRYETTDTPTAPFRDAAGTLAEGGQFD